ncbi:putative nucleoprotein [Hubei lepidoptera virus 2]|uniref:Nucleoprotein n=1 Tax=Hubei lepidoptera virus 2 TaxID=1922904 RepID=A0A1L3KMX4_9RHAB|nr:putative nucleoprotein [Hubei lepidoptera virus 2]APG78679.1 putative nucleoprotein [Hubei lepidoptera virus 2]
MANLDKRTSIYLPTGKAVTLEYQDEALETSYPADWFAKNPGQKPTVTIPIYKVDLTQLGNAVRIGIRRNCLSVSTAKAFLYEYGKTVTDKLTERWDSFGCLIGDPNQEITPWDIVTVKEEGDGVTTEAGLSTADLNAPNGPGQWTNKALALYILCIYRLLRVTDDTYSEELQQRMMNQLKPLGGEHMSFHGVRGFYQSWLSDLGFTKMVAAYDMFLHYFKHHEHGLLRIGTLSSRHKDCAALLSIGYLEHILNIEAAELMDWIFLPAMGIEMTKLTKEGQESGKPSSYFPYQADLGLVIRSAYSSTANPYLFHWIHVSGSLLGNKRSINARNNFEGNVADLCLNAVILAWAYGRGGALAPQFSRTGQAPEEPEDDPEEDEGEDISSGDKLWWSVSGRDPASWFAVLSGSRFRVPESVRREIKNLQGKIQDRREATVGKFVKESLIY